MPELPEIQAHAERLAQDYVGMTLETFEVISFTVLKTYKPFPEEITGRTLDEISYRGKHLLFRFGDITQVIHLMQGGRLKPDEKLAKKPRGGLARWRFEDGYALLFTEAGTERKAGIWQYDGDPHSHEPLDHLGPDANQVSESELSDLLANHSGRLHGWLRKQREIAGVGRMLANEICHRAKISPFANTKKLTEQEAKQLAKAIDEALSFALEFERSLEEMSYSKERPSRVHHRKGEPCEVCSDTISAVEYNRYTVFYCPTCQTDGKKLADNTTSKFLK